jgi:ornithine decarboxylase
MADTFTSAAALLARHSPVDPVVGLRPHLIRARARRMLATFPGDVLYAVKCNDAPEVLTALWAGGVREYDTASIGEVRAVRRLLPQARCHFMHPVKATAAIAEAYREHGVRRFVCDHPDELAKIVAATGGPTDLELFVRLAVPGDGAVLALTGKFGAGVAEAAALVRTARGYARRVGLTFHVGSQCVEPRAYARAVALAAEVVRQVGPIDDLDVGGGFPAAYQGDEPPFAAFVAAICTAVAEHGLTCRLQCEPGRALVADGASALARIELRRGDGLYLNDGVFGNLGELKWIGPCFPMRLVRPPRRTDRTCQGFDLFGPTCDSFDSMPGPHRLPVDADEGDWVEVGMMGAYSNAMRSGFNGFSSEKLAILSDGGWYLGGRRRQAGPATGLLAA